MKFEIGQQVKIVAGWFPNLVGTVAIVEDCWSTDVKAGGLVVRIVESYRLAGHTEATWMGTELEAIDE